MTYEAKNYERLLGTEGLSDSLLKNHFALYQGYVTNVNKLLQELEAPDKSSPQYAELKRRFGWEFNGLRLHELYFENMVKNGVALDNQSSFHQKIISNFGSFGAWLNDFKATGTMRGIGWVILYRDPISNRLFNTWVNEHDKGHLAGAIPLLVLDVFEHAYVLDYGLKRADYIEAFLVALDWSVIQNRFLRQ